MRERTRNVTFADRGSLGGVVAASRLGPRDSFVERRQRALEAKVDVLEGEAVLGGGDNGIGFVLEHSHPFMPWINKDGTWGCTGGIVASAVDAWSVSPLNVANANEYLTLEIFINASDGKFTVPGGVAFGGNNGADGWKPVIESLQARIPLAKYDAAAKAVIPYYCYQSIILPVQKYKVAAPQAENHLVWDGNGFLYRIGWDVLDWGMGGSTG